METLTWLSIIPPILVVVLAISTKSIIFSLVMGIATGLTIFASIVAPGVLPSKDFLEVMIYGLRLFVASVGTPENLMLILFLAILGGIIAILTAAGCANSFSASALKRIKNKRTAEAFTFLMGCVIFVDDYFNAITVGNVMVSVTDKFKISRAKLAYLIDSTSAPVTILMPVSSWVATVISLIIPELEACGMPQPGMQAFLNCTVYNFYAWFTLLMVVTVIIFDLNLGKMKYYEQKFAQTGKDESIFVDVNESVVDDMARKRRGTALDMIVVLVLLVVLTFAIMLYTGGIFEAGITVQTALINCDPNISLASAALITLAFCYIIFIFGKKLTFKNINEAFVQGVKSMVTAVMILVMSWTFSAVLGTEGLNTGAFIANACSESISGWMLPAIVFILSAVISFSIGASWGAMGIMLPTSIAMCASVDPNYIYMVLGATLAGSVFGDHCSPLADTTVLSSSGAGCKHLAHVYTQLPYALIVSLICIASYIVSGLTGKAWPGFVLAAVVLVILGVILKKNREIKTISENLN